MGKWVSNGASHERACERASERGGLDALALQRSTASSWRLGIQLRARLVAWVNLRQKEGW